MTRPAEPVFEFISRGPDQTRQFGMSLGRLLRDGDLICLQGDLGAGKTTLVQGVARGWGSPDAVSSPTFVLVNLYRRPDGGQLYHLDTYRLDSASEAEQLDLDEMLSQGALLIEWPERAGAALPPEHLWVHLAHAGETERTMRFAASGARYESLLAELSHAIGG
jgi:tRNA threonylcarbamoyladenosine biosynthesis protein TsaE